MFVIKNEKERTVHILGYNVYYLVQVQAIFMGMESISGSYLQILCVFNSFRVP